MELTFIIAFAIMIGLVELKEWRLKKQIDEALDQIDSLGEEVFSLRGVILRNQETIDKMSQSVAMSLENSEYAKEFAEFAKADLGTILKEYEINGVPLGYQRAPADFIEGV